jgi:sterol desaturase/sphingolipid hydroxylase (fatty acid hydroxylase superfamily)
MFGWPVTKYRLGLSTNYVWNIEESMLGSNVIANVIFFIVFVLAIDLYTYFKHRMLHLKYFFAFHENHHLNFNPTAFASYSTSPFEALLTFVPARKENFIFILCN